MTKSVFISSTSMDLREYRKAVIDAITRLNLHPIDFEAQGSRPGGAAGASRLEVKRADMFVGILAYRYGYVMQGDTKSVTEQEYDEAVAQNILRFMYLVHPDYPWPPDLVEQGEEAHKRLAAFKEHVEKQEVRSYFTTPQDLALKVAADLAAEMMRQDDLERKEPSSVPPNARSRLPLMLAMAVILLIALAIIPLVRPDILVRLGLVPPPTMPAPPPGQVNVVVAGFGLEQVNGAVRSDPLADDVSATFLTQLTEVSGIANTRGPTDLGVGTILETDKTRRADHAAQISKQLHATLVIYGLVQDQGNGNLEIHPEFYLSPDFAATEPELVGADTLGKPFLMLKDWTGGGPLADRIETLKAFLTGLGQYYSGKYTDAQVAFDAATRIDDNVKGGLEVLDIFAGNAAARQDHFADALAFYTETLQTRPTYARGLLGRGGALFQIAGQIRRDQNPTYDPAVKLPAGILCKQNPPDMTKIEFLIQLAEICYKEAEQSTDRAELADLDVKIPYQFGSLYLWRAKYGFGDYWNEAEKNLQAVITIYNGSLQDKQRRIRIFAARAHGFLADMLVTRSPNDPQAIAQAVDHFDQAVSLYKIDVDQPYAATFIPPYQTLEAGLQLTSTAVARGK